MKTDILTILLTTGVITTLFTSIINILISTRTNKNVKDVEKLKRRYQLDFLRFEKINSIQPELDKYYIASSFDVRDAENSSLKRGETVTKLINDGEALINLFNLNKPYFDKDVREYLETKSKDYSDLRWSLQELIIKGHGNINPSDLKRFDENLDKLFSLGYEFRKDFENSIRTQMIRLDISAQ